MFSSINFLFLTSLAITSWIILCYFKQIEEQRMEDINEHFRMERSFEEPLRACRENYDLYLNFLCIFACIYALAKVTHMTESFIAKHVHAKFLSKMDKTYDTSTEKHILEEYRAQQENLVLQINNLKRSNNQLEQQLQQSKEQLELQLRESKSQLEQRLHQLQQNSKVFVMGNSLPNEGEEESMIEKTLFKSSNNNSNNSSSSSSISNSNNNNNNHNIFISNRHIHVNRQVYVNEGNVKLNLPQHKQNTGGFSQIWSKYLEMQKFAIKTPVMKNQSPQANAVPIVVSTEQLQTIQGLY